MLYSGISWSADGFTVDVIDEHGEQRQPSRLFGPRHTQELIRYLHGFEVELAAVVDSTNGVLDGRMMAEGLTVYRADPQHLGERPVFASVPATDIAAAARRGLGVLTRLQCDRGTQTGREPDLAEFARTSERALADWTGRRTCVSRGSGERREISLTFDDGPQPPYTGQVLDVLRRYDVPATFFCTGMYAMAYPEYLARMLEEGHSIANHTWSHPMLFELTRAQLVEQLERTSEAIAAAADGRAPALFRPPYGSRTPEVLGWLAESGLTTVLWDVAPDDWQMPGVDAIATTVVEQARPGSIVLLHDSGGDRSQTVAALAPMVEGLLERGFSIVPVEQQLAAAALAGGRR
ncbi:polysaccharide deacetylase family protein [Streptomyces sp. HNM0663]|uniref:Polysaccharide deacetylase family protein n=1 Tax=Streptomyces chengmaiensis TaxID=3040919 RepID=A0ABT6HZC3_9ACTN|nr:polysaccharide deacetylase family protein [Streptomyces chengmaiensis]MDH2393706.1 polysaccharide deacetylase family protein [Streptomyces chengmaiensis]